MTDVTGIPESITGLVLDVHLTTHLAGSAWISTRSGTAPDSLVHQLAPLVIGLTIALTLGAGFYLLAGSHVWSSHDRSNTTVRSGQLALRGRSTGERR